MGLHKPAGLVVRAGDVILQPLALDPPLPSAADLDGRQLAAADQGVGLSGRDVEDFGDVAQLKESRRRHGASLPFGGDPTRDVHSPSPPILSSRAQSLGIGHYFSVARAVGDVAAVPASPAARRLATPRWLDGRLVVGVLLVLLAVVLGTRIFATADRYSTVFVAARPLVPGERIATGDLRTGRVRFHGQAGWYVAAGAAPVGYLVMHYVGPGELVPRSALSPAASVQQATRLVTVPVASGHLPVGLSHGDLVDVYLTPKVGAGQRVPSPTQVLNAVPVDSTDGSSGGLAPSDAVSVVLAVPVGEVPATVHAVESGSIDVVRVPVAPSPAAP